MFVVCVAVTMACCYVVDQAFHNSYITWTLATLMASSSGLFYAIDKRRQQDTNDSKKSGS